MPKNQLIERLRGPKNHVDPYIPYDFIHEEEVDARGKLYRVNTIFLTNKECSFRCTMCDLWKNTLDTSTPLGAIPEQIRYALDRLPKASVIKLYNSGNFFDPKAIPPDDYLAIANLLDTYERVIVENHPKLCNDLCLEFNTLLNGQLEIAIGLETIHPEVLEKLNKQLTVNDFQKAVEFLISNHIDTRTFILLNPPYLISEEENIRWAVNTVNFALDCGVSCCTIIPTRPGNGIMDKLQRESLYVPPTINALEKTLEKCLPENRGRVLVDLWDLEFFSNCERCFEARLKCLESMNRGQKPQPKVICNCQND